MSVWSRIAAAAFVWLLGVSAEAYAQKTPKKRADELNNEGRELFGAGKLGAAANKFRQAIVMSPEGRFYFNLCYALDRQKRYREAIIACEAVAANGASDRLKEKTERLMEVIRKKIPAPAPAPKTAPKKPTQPAKPDPPPPDPADPYANAEPTSKPGSPPPQPDPAIKTAAHTGGGSGAGGGTGGSLPDAGASEPAVQVEKKPTGHPYSWALGFELGGVSSTIGDDVAYGDGGVLFRGHADFVLSQSRRLGIQPYFTITQVAAGDLGEELRVLDLGLAVYKNIQLGGSKLYFTPLAGAQIALMSPEGLAQAGSSLVGIGMRGELELAYLFGKRSRNALRVVAGFNGYAGARGGGDFDPADFGLDEPGATSYFLFGFTRRFTSKFGTRAMFTLE